MRQTKENTTCWNERERENRKRRRGRGKGSELLFHLVGRLFVVFMLLLFLLLAKETFLLLLLVVRSHDDDGGRRKRLDRGQERGHEEFRNPKDHRKIAIRVF